MESSEIVVEQPYIGEIVPTVADFNPTWLKDTTDSKILIAAEYAHLYSGRHVVHNGVRTKVTRQFCADAFGCSISSIKRAIKAHHQNRTIWSKSAASGRRRMSVENEELLARHIKELTERCGVWINSRLATDMALLINDEVQYTYGWFRGFCERNALTLKYGRVTPMDPQRLLAENKSKIKQWFESNRITITSVSADNLYNVGETGFNMYERYDNVSVGSNKVRHGVLDTGRSMHITSIDCISAGGYQVPPMIVIPSHKPGYLRKLDNEVQKNIPGPQKWKFTSQVSGYADAAVFLEWIKHFDKCTRNGTEPQSRILLLDGFRTHFSESIRNYAQENKITLVAFPPNLTHLMQPLDVGYFGPLKSLLRRLITDFMRETGLRMNLILEWQDLLRKSHAQLGGQIGVRAFEKCGLFPYNPDVSLDQIENQISSRTKEYNDQETEARADSHGIDEQCRVEEDSGDSRDDSGESLQEGQQGPEDDLLMEQQQGLEYESPDNYANIASVVEDNDESLLEDQSQDVSVNLRPSTPEALEIHANVSKQKSKFEQYLIDIVTSRTQRKELIDNFSKQANAFLSSNRRDIGRMQVALNESITLMHALLEQDSWSDLSLLPDQENLSVFNRLLERNLSKLREAVFQIERAIKAAEEMATNTLDHRNTISTFIDSVRAEDEINFMTFESCCHYGAFQESERRYESLKRKQNEVVQERSDRGVQYVARDKRAKSGIMGRPRLDHCPSCNRSDHRSRNNKICPMNLRNKSQSQGTDSSSTLSD